MRNAISKLLARLSQTQPVSYQDPKALANRRFHELERARLNSFQI